MTATTNLLVAIKNIAADPITNLTDHYSGINSFGRLRGSVLERYIEDVFCGTVNVFDENQRNDILSQNFSYLGNLNNPPHVLIQGGDAIEIRKIESNSSSISVSAPPKDILYADSTISADACKTREEWMQKDLLYVIGAGSENAMKSLWLIYGDCYFASRDFYQKLLNVTDLTCNTTFRLSRGIAISPAQLLAKTNPQIVHGYMNVLMTKQKYESFASSARRELESLANDSLTISNCIIPSPNNPSVPLETKFISYRYLQ